MPIYHQIAMRLEQKIASGEFPVDSQIPSERDLAITFGASRTTMRQALSVLEASGILERRRPKGTFVRGKPEKLAPTLSIPVSFIRSMILSGHDVTLELLRTFCTDLHDTTANSALGIDDGQAVTIYERIIRSEMLTIAYIESFVPNSLFPDVINQQLVDDSIHQTLLRRYGTIISEADHAIECATASTKAAALLDTEVGSPILKLESCYYDQHGQPVEFVYTHWRADVMKLRMRTALEPYSRGSLAD